MKFLGALLLAFTFAGAVHSAEVDTSDPTKLVEGTAQAMLDELNKNRAEYRKDPAKVYALVDRLLLPHFDTQYAAQRVLGRHWRSATAEQRQRFIDAFYKSMLHNYGDALVDFTGDRLKVLPTREGSSDPENAIVRTQVKRDNGALIPVNYSLRKTPEGWKAWDVNIEGISYVRSFREDFGAQIDAEGLDAVIQRLEQGAKPRSAKAASS